LAEDSGGEPAEVLRAASSILTKVTIFSALS
jgi:hypothetical protein